MAALSAGIADELGLDEASGVVVLDVKPGSIAANLGFKAGDLVMQIGDTQITSLGELDRAVARRQRLWQMSVKRGDRVLQLQVPG